MSKTYYQLLFNTANVQKVLPKSLADSFLSEQLEGIGSKKSLMGTSDFKTSAKDAAILHSKIEHFAKEALGNLNQLQSQQSVIRKMFDKHTRILEEEKEDLTIAKPPTGTRGTMRSRSHTGLSSRSSSAGGRRTGSAKDANVRPGSSIAFGIDLSEYLVSTVVKRKKEEELTRRESLLSQSKSGLSSSKIKFLTASKGNVFTGAAGSGEKYEDPKKREKEIRQKRVDGFLQMLDKPFVQMDLGLKGPGAFNDFYQLSLDKLVIEEQQYGNLLTELKSIPENEELAKQFNQRATKRRGERKYTSQLEREFDKIKNTRYIRNFRPFQADTADTVKSEEFM